MRKYYLPIQSCSLTHTRVRLATTFHTEHLLEREHYMDWLVSSLENSPQEKLPMWLLITQVYWKDLLRYRKFGRRLTTALLNHMTEVCFEVLYPKNYILTVLEGYQSC